MLVTGACWRGSRLSEQGQLPLRAAGRRGVPKVLHQQQLRHAQNTGRAAGESLGLNLRCHGTLFSLGKKKKRPPAVVSPRPQTFPGQRMLEEGALGARRHFSGCSGKACSEADPELGPEPREWGLAQLSKWLHFSRLLRASGTAHRQDLPPQAFRPLQMVGRAAATVRSPW